MAVDSSAAIRAFVRRARRRLAFVRAAFWAQRSLFAVLGLAAAVVAFERLTGLWTPPSWIIPAAGSGAVLVASAIAYWVPRRGLLSTAAAVDAKAGWKEALSSAMALGYPKEPMEMALVEYASARARHTRPAALFPFRAPREMRWIFAPAALAIAAALFLPRLDLLGVEAEARKEEQKKSQFQKVIEKLEKNREKLARGEKAERPQTVAAEARKELERLQEELGKNPLERKDAMAELSRAEEKLRNLQKELAESRDLAMRLQKAMEKQGEDAGELGGKIKQGKFDEAADELAKLRERMQEGKLSEEEKRKLGEKLESLRCRLAGDPKLEKFEKAVSKALEGLGENREMDFGDFQDALQELDGDMAQLEALEDALREMQGMKDELAKGEGSEEGTCPGCGEPLGEGAQGGGGEGEGEGEGQGEGQGKKPGGGKAKGKGKKGCNGCAEWLSRMAGKSQGNGPGMGGPGQGEGGVAPETPGDTGMEKTKIPGQMGPGKIVGAWTTKGEPPKGEARVEFEKVVEAAAEEAMDALSRQRVPATHRNYVRDYFEAIRGKNPATPDK